MSAERELGVHAEAINALKQDVAQIKGDLNEIKLLLAGARGGWKSLMWVGGFASAAGAALWHVAGWVSRLTHGS